MNDLSKKQEVQHEEKAKTLPSNALLQKKLENYLLLFYQGYLKGETAIVPEIGVAFLELVKHNEDIAFKVRMQQLDYLNLENKELEGTWNEAAEVLFPEVKALDKPIEESRQKTLAEYEETILEMINSSSELGS